MSAQLTTTTDREMNARPINSLAAIPQQPPIGNLADALAKARDQCKRAEKDATNQHHKYRYASADEVVATASEALKGSGLGLIPIREEMTVSGSGNLMFYALNRTLLLAHSSGEAVPLEIRGWPVVPERGRPLDKAYAIALTSSLAYKLRDLLQMPRGDSSDDVSSQQDTRTPAPVSAQQAAEPQSEAPANPMDAPQAESGSLTEQEYQDLVATARANRRTVNDVNRLLAVLGVKVLQQVPRTKLAWTQFALQSGLVQTVQVDRINGLREQLQIDPALFSARLQEVYGVSSIAHLLPSQANELEQKLKGRVQPQPA